MNGAFKNILFDFCLHSANVLVSAEKDVPFGKYIIGTNKSTPIFVSKQNDRELVLLGYAVNVKNGESEGLAQSFLESTSCLQEAIGSEKYLGGKYLLFYREEDDYYVIPDATASIPLCYANKDDEVICTSNPSVIAEKFGFSPAPRLQKIRKCSDISQAMPFDLTIYDEVKQLLPNHYLDVNENRAIRFINEKSNQCELSPEQAAEITAPYIENIARYYISSFKVYCPITAGRDSRVVLAYLLKYIDKEQLECYTIRHKEHTGEEQDLLVPQELCKKIGFSYRQIIDVENPEELVQKADASFGVEQYSKRTLKIANTVLCNCGDGAIINGDIIGQVGKCSLHRDIPSYLATAGYFRCKLHNYSKESKQELQQWLDEIAEYGEKVNTFDLFSIENRIGRWAGQENLIYNTIGQAYLNIFNSRSIIYEWTRVGRALRKESAVHIALIKEINQELLEVPFEKDSGFIELFAKSTGMLYYLFGYLKYFVQKLQFIVKKQT